MHLGYVFNLSFGVAGVAGDLDLSNCGLRTRGNQKDQIHQLILRSRIFLDRNAGAIVSVLLHQSLNIAKRTIYFWAFVNLAQLELARIRDLISGWTISIAFDPHITDEKTLRGNESEIDRAVIPLRSFQLNVCEMPRA